MEDSLSLALREAPIHALRLVHDRPAEEAPCSLPLREALDDIAEQTLSVLMSPFFDRELQSNRSPIIRSGLSEAGTLNIRAHRQLPSYRADMTIYVRRNADASGARYHVRGLCHLSREDGTPRLSHTFPIAIAISDASVTIDVAKLRAEMAASIRAFGR